MRLAAFLVLPMLGCATTRVPPYPTLDPGKPVVIGRDGYTQDGHPVSRVELDARLLEMPDTRESVAQSHRLMNRSGYFLVVGAGLFGVAGGVNRSPATLAWGTAAAAAIAGWLYTGRSGAEVHRKAVESYNARLVGTGSPSPCRTTEGR